METEGLVGPAALEGEDGPSTVIKSARPGITEQMGMRCPGAAGERSREASLHRNTQKNFYSMGLRILKKSCFVAVFKQGSNMLAGTFGECESEALKILHEVKQNYVQSESARD